MTASQPMIPAHVVKVGQQALEKLIGPVDGVRVALLSTPDGFEIASLRTNSELQLNRLSAMAGSLMAMARAVGREINHAGCKRLTFETDSGVVVFQSVMSEFPCILCMVLDTNAILGRVLWAAAEVGAEMNKP